MSIFEPRTHIKPYEYPNLLDYVDAIRHSYWVHTEYNFTSDIQDWNVNMSDNEKEVVKRTMLAISQIEVAVKKFWWRIDDMFPKPEVSSVGATFAESEVRHQDAYSHLLELLWLNEEFEKLTQVTCIAKRIDYMKEIMKQENYEKIALFSILIEHVSLFSQFYIMMSFNKHRNMLSWISNVVEATSKEENIHWMFGIELINIIKEETWDDEIEFDESMKWLCSEAFNAELEILDWIFEDWDLDFVSKKEVIEFIKSRMNKSLKQVWVDLSMPVDEDIIAKTKWFDDEISTTKHTDFFVKRSVNYTKFSKPVTEDDLF